MKKRKRSMKGKGSTHRPLWHCSSCCSTVQGVPAGASVVVVVVEVVVVVGGTQQRLPVSQDQPGNRRQLNVPGGQTLGVHGEDTWHGTGNSVSK